MSGQPVYITSGNGQPVNVTGASAGSIPASSIANPVGSTTDAPIVTGSAGNIVSAPGFYQMVLFNTALPFINASTGTMGNNGALTLGTALSLTYANAYVYLPASAISSGSAAGWYFCQMSSTTVGTVFNNTYTSGQPTIPPSPTAFATTGPGAFTGIITTQNAVSITVPANILGIRDVLQCNFKLSCTNNANNKGYALSFGGSTVAGQTTALTSEAGVISIVDISNRESQSSQICGTLQGLLGSISGNIIATTVNTANSQTLLVTLSHGTATDNVVLESLVVEILKGS